MQAGCQCRHAPKPAGASSNLSPPGPGSGAARSAGLPPAAPVRTSGGAAPGAAGSAAPAPGRAPLCRAGRPCSRSDLYQGGAVPKDARACGRRRAQCAWQAAAGRPAAAHSLQRSQRCSTSLAGQVRQLWCDKERKREKRRNLTFVVFRPLSRRLQAALPSDSKGWRPGQVSPTAVERRAVTSDFSTVHLMRDFHSRTYEYAVYCTSFRTLPA